MSIGSKAAGPALGVPRQRSGHPAELGGHAPARRASGAETLEYLSDMIEQLRGLAERAGYPVLAGLLDRAHLEARVQREEQ